MPRKRHTPDQVINKLREAEVQVLVEQYSQVYNGIRQHSSLG